MKTEKEKEKDCNLSNRILGYCIILLEISICHSIYLISGKSWIITILSYIGLIIFQVKYICIRIQNFEKILIENKNKAEELASSLKPEISLMLLGLMVILRLIVLHI